MGSDCCKESKQDEKVTEEVGATEITNADDAPEKDYQAAYRRAETKNNANGADKQKRYSQKERDAEKFEKDMLEKHEKNGALGLGLIPMK